jgi:carbamoyl-phosphate synthase small subunit
MTGQHSLMQNTRSSAQPALEKRLDVASPRRGKLVLEDGTVFEGTSFGYDGPAAGEVVFSTGMVGYPEALTDPSFRGQILIMTYPLVGNYGVPDPCAWEGERIHVSGLIVSHYIDSPSHWQSTMNLGTWLWREQVPALQIKDTRLLTQHIRSHGVLLGKIVFERDVPFFDPNLENLVARVSIPGVVAQGAGDLTLALIDCGAKRNIVRSLLARNVRVVRIPWDYDPFTRGARLSFDGIVVSNGPGDLKMVRQTIRTVRKALEQRIPTLGICLGHQVLALAAEGDTYKLKFGHRSQNQPCVLYGTQRCYITTQNHGFAVGSVPPGFDPWFVNANDGSNEGLRHRSLPFCSVQFHPEASPGPTDTAWIFDDFLQQVRGWQSTRVLAL